MVTELALLEGGSALAVMIFSCMFGFISLYKGRKLEAKLLCYAGILMVFVGLLYLGPVSDFFSILLFQRNIDNSFGLYGLLSYMWVGPAIIVAMIIGTEMMTPDKKKEIVLSFSVLGLIFELFLFLNTMDSFTFVDPLNPAEGLIPGGDMIDSRFVTLSAAFIFIAFFLVCVLIFNGIGFLVKALKSSGIVKKKFIYLSLGFIIFVIAGAMDSLVTPGPMLFFVRVGMMVSVVCMYLGLKS